MSASAFENSANVARPETSSVRSKRTVRPVLPATWFSTLTAATSAVPCVPWVAMPPATARLGLRFENSFARRAIVSAGTSVSAATFSGVQSATAFLSAARSLAAGPKPWFTMTFAIPSATANSVPGFAATHSSALAPVVESRGSTATKWPPPSSRCVRIAAKPRCCATGDRNVSSRSAPNAIRQRAEPTS